ncbi:hypothetical protein [Sphaerospermopsis aphanizomenoides]|nr:hypothetical protein [Sphaerospermopsis aphanizomenoides]
MVRIALSLAYRSAIACDVILGNAIACNVMLFWEMRSLLDKIE